METKKVNPKKLQKGLNVKVIRGRHTGQTGVVNFWYEPTKEDPNWQIDVRVGEEIVYLGLGDIRLTSKVSKISKKAIERVYKINHKIKMLQDQRNQIISKEVKKQGFAYDDFDLAYGKETVGR